MSLRPENIQTEIIKPVVNLRLWSLSLCEIQSFSYNAMQTAGLRKMTVQDFPIVIALTNKYTSQFEIECIFQTEEEFSFWFLFPDTTAVTYVVEDPITGNITDMFSFQILIEDKTLGRVAAIVNTKTPAKQLLADLLLCAKQNQLLQIATYQLQYGLKDFEKLLATIPLMCVYTFYTIPPLYLYNYNYSEVDEEKIVLFPFVQQS